MKCLSTTDLYVKDYNRIQTSHRISRQQRWKIQRKRQLRNRFILFVFTLFFVLTAAFSYHTMVSHAETDIEQFSFKYYTEYEVVYGDTLWSISQKYLDSHYTGTFDYVKEVVSINHLSSDLLKVGQVLILPYYSTEYIK